VRKDAKVASEELTGTVKRTRGIFRCDYRGAEEAWGSQLGRCQWSFSRGRDGAISWEGFNGHASWSRVRSGWYEMCWIDWPSCASPGVWGMRQLVAGLASGSLLKKEWVVAPRNPGTTSDVAARGASCPLLDGQVCLTSVKANKIRYSITLLRLPLASMKRVYVGIYLYIRKRETVRLGLDKTSSPVMRPMYEFVASLLISNCQAQCQSQ